MAKTLPTNPLLSAAGQGLQGLALWAGSIRRDLMQVLSEHARAINRTPTVDSGLLADIIRFPTYAVADAPDEATYAGGVIFVSDETGGPTLAYSDGSDWRRVYDNAVITT